MNGDNKWNILFVIQSLYGGGAELVVENLCKYVNKKLFNITVCHTKERGERGDNLLKLGFDVIRVSSLNPFRADYFTFFKLRRVIRQKRIHIIHSHSVDALIDSSLCRLSLKGLKLVHTFHFGNYPNYIKKYMFMEKIFWRAPDRLISVGYEQRKEIQKTYGIPNQRIQTIWNGVAVKEPDLDKNILEKFSSDKKLIIGSISTLFEQKGISFLLEVAKILKKRGHHLTFLVIGAGPLREALEMKCRSLYLKDTVYFLGWIKDAPTKVLPMFDIFFQPSLWEAMSMVLLEAMAAGKAIISTNVGEAKHIIENGKDGLIVKPKDINAMVSAIEKLICNPELRCRLGLMAKKKLEKYCTVEIMAKNYEKLYLDLLTMKRTGVNPIDCTKYD